MRRSILVFLLGVLAGGLALALVNLPSPEEEIAANAENNRVESLTAELATVRAELTQAEAKIKALEAAAPVASVDPDNPTASETGEPAPIANFAELLTEARPLIQRMAPMFENMRKQGQEQWIAGEVAKWTEKLDLSPEQAEAVTKLMTERADAFAAEDAARLQDTSVPVTQMFANRETWERRALAIDEVMEESLNAEQYDTYRTEQLTDRAGRITDSANRRVESMSETLSLDNTQQDQLFEILVKKSPSYDDEMQIETSLDGSLAETLSPEVSEEDAIRRILREDQAPAYETYLQERQQRRNGFFPGFGR